jgi:hypothetical protein
MLSLRDRKNLFKIKIERTTKKISSDKVIPYVCSHCGNLDLYINSYCPKCEKVVKTVPFYVWLFGEEGLSPFPKYVDVNDLTF